MEILLYVSTQKQIGEAIRLVGLKPQTSKMAAVVVSDNELMASQVIQRLESLVPGVQDSSISSKIESRKIKSLKHLYGIDAPELEALSSTNENAFKWLIIERSALLDARR
jgi:tRNA threonylcarbamoyladenosine modification (KEOPS) complex Cgi121 subunit